MVRASVVLPVEGQSDLFERGSAVTVPAARTASVAAGDGQNTVSWDTETGATGYRIYWDTSSGVTESSNLIEVDGESTDEYTHTGLTNGTTYYYKVSAVGPWGITPLSSEVSSTPSALTLSLKLDGATQYVDFGANHDYENSDAWSMAVWARPQNLAAQRCLWSNTSLDTNVFGWGMYVRTDGKLLLQMRASGQLRQHVTTDVSFASLAWTHFCMTYSGAQNINGCKFYFDGAEDSGGSPASGSVTNTLLHSDPSVLGRRSSSFYFNGWLFQLLFFNVELSSSEVSELYNGGTPIDPLGHSQAANIDHKYNLGNGDTLPTLTDSVGSVDGTAVNSPVFEAEVP